MFATPRSLAIAAVIALCGGSEALAANATIAGGELDPGVTNADVYVGTPTAGKVPSTAACRQTQKYVEDVQAGRYADVVDLFADDAVVLEPTRQNTIGRERIAAFYQGTIGKMKPEIVAVSYVGNGADCMVALSVRANIGGEMRYRLASADYFTLNASGKFSRMIAFVRP